MTNLNTVFKKYKFFKNKYYNRNIKLILKYKIYNGKLLNKLN